MQALLKYGKDWDAIVNMVGSRDTVNVRSHAQKFFFKLIKYLEGAGGKTKIEHAEKYYAILHNKFNKKKDDEDQGTVRNIF